MEEQKSIVPIKNLKMTFELGAYYKVCNDDSYEIFRFISNDPPRVYVVGKGETTLPQVLFGFLYVEFLGHSLE